MKLIICAVMYRSTTDLLHWANHVTSCPTLNGVGVWDKGLCDIHIFPAQPDPFHWVKHMLSPVLTLIVGQGVM